jgi:ADP-heptose:LPS heptosyltransferase
MAEPRRVLVIRLGAFGDFVQSFGPFAAIRAHHPAAWITLLTTAAYAPLASLAPWFDEVAVDRRPGLLNPAGLLRLRRQLRGFDMVYDLQTSGRSTAYVWLAGIGRFRRFAHRDPNRDRLHTQDRQRGQLRDAGIVDIPKPNMEWLTRSPVPALPQPYALLVPGASPNRPQKRWPAPQFAELARRIAAAGTTPVLIGGVFEDAIAAEIARAAPRTINLVGKTDLIAVAALAHRAVYAVGNDTGPMHLAAAVGCRCIVLFGGASDPALTAPRAPDGAWATVLRAPDLADLPVERVAAALP